MTHVTEPKVFCIGETRINNDELHNYLKSIGAEDWDTGNNEPNLDDISEIIEVNGRGCYLSFGTELNNNITRVREGNKAYISNIINVKHGSVLEHGFVNFQIVDVSRVFTHELVRHRAGTAISQESLRFVRANDLSYWIPKCFTSNNEHLNEVIKVLFQNQFMDSENRYLSLLRCAAEIETGNHSLNSFDELSFELKKKYTSAARRLLPIGIATKIGWSCNIRSLRAILEQRTHPSSEEEIRLVFGEIGIIAKERWPNLFADYKVEVIDGYLYFSTNNMKV